MDVKKYQEIVDKHKSNENKLSNMLVSFITGGIIGLVANFLIDFYSYVFHISNKVASSYMLITFIFIACLLTGIGVFDTLVKKFKMGLIIPITGFAHSMESAMLDYKKEGPIYGIGSNAFKLAGSVILYGVVSAYVFGLIRYLFIGV